MRTLNRLTQQYQRVFHVVQDIDEHHDVEAGVPMRNDGAVELIDWDMRLRAAKYRCL